jgi:nicotinate-nucleotide pyrophosphorylase (carboxylating)
MRDFQQIEWDAAVEEDCRQLVRLAVREDLERLYDWTTVALVGSDARGSAAVVARRPGVACGLRAAALVLAEMDAQVAWRPEVEDGAVMAAGTRVATIAGSARTLLTAERTLLNFVGHLSGVSTLTRQYVDAVAGTRARIYDTRKTTPGWRRLEKYAVRAGGGHNHRTGLFDAILIKDNHLAWGAGAGAQGRFTPAQAVRRARDFLTQLAPGDPRSQMLVEVEVDTLDQLDEVLPTGPDIVLLDNMPAQRLREAVERRNRVAPQVELEASGGVNLSTIRGLAQSGVDRISVGALTHSAEWFDVGLDWGA